MNSMETVNVVFAGIGGQGVILASDLLTVAAFRSGYDVKKSELHGMSQRGLGDVKLFGSGGKRSALRKGEELS